MSEYIISKSKTHRLDISIHRDESLHCDTANKTHGLHQVNHDDLPTAVSRMEISSEPINKQMKFDDINLINLISEYVEDIEEAVLLKDYIVKSIEDKYVPHFLILYGCGSNGKSTFINEIMTKFGGEMNHVMDIPSNVSNNRRLIIFTDPSSIFKKRLGHFHNRNAVTTSNMIIVTNDLEFYEKEKHKNFYKLITFNKVF
jgi:hypothetical protein